MRNSELTSIVPCRRAPLPAEMEAAFAEFLRVDVASGDASPDTTEHYLNEVEYWVAWCAEQGFDPAKITTAHIKRYRQALIEANYNPVTTGWKLMVVRRFYEAARSAGLRQDNPAAGVKGPRVRHAAEDFKYLSEEQLAALLAAIPDPDAVTGWDKLRRMRNQLMVGMMALQALRTIEVQRANVEDLTDKGEHLVMLVRGKTKDRIAYMRPDVAARVREYLALRGPVPRDADGTPLFSTIGYHPHRLGRPHVRLCTAQCLRLAGLKRPGISNHALRHTAATLGYLHTGDLRAVQDFLGHADPRMTSRYAHVVDMAKRNPALFIPVKTA
ncbi:MAG: tyrosine-type recombinase/integrase [Acidobacteria bacterium]|nr:tyrosine-type recombinase/integrase [Acidobacteriota bacterium]